MVFEVGDVGVAPQKPYKFMDDRLEVQPLGRHKREAFAEIEADLSAEERLYPCSRAICLLLPRIKGLAKQIEIGAHFKPGIVKRLL